MVPEESPDALTVSVAARLTAVRRDRGFSLNALAGLSGVSRAMIAKIERGQAQPTAALLGRLTAALGITMSELFAWGETKGPLLTRRDTQREWTDPGTGYHRRSLSPEDGGPLQLVEIELPAGARVRYPADAYRFIRQQIWVLSGTLTFLEGTTEHRLEPGDCLALGAPQDCEFGNDGTEQCRYLVAVVRKNN